MINVVVVDDETLVRSGLSLILSSAPDIDVLATCTGAEAVTTVGTAAPQVVLLDIQKDVDDLTVLRSLRALPEAPAVAMLTTFDSDQHIGSALRGGAAGLLLKDTSPEQLIHAVRALAKGDRALSPAVTDAVIARYLDFGPDHQSAARLRRMTTRELDVLALLGEGLSNAEIAARLFLSPGTVKDHISSILTKLGSSNRVQAAVFAHQAGILGEPRDSP